MPLILTAKFTFNPETILNDAWTHDMARWIVEAKMLAVGKENGAFPRAAR